MEDYLIGKKLYGDDFSLEEIRTWFNEEAEGYANLLGDEEKKNFTYEYHELNKIYGFNKIKKDKIFTHALGFGSAFGNEFEPVISRIQSITIIEPSDQLFSHTIGNIKPVYVKPDISGKLPFESNSFDLITCFGTLHHIPNVSTVLSEMIRVLKPDGYMLIREPINSMGDWREKRDGLTKNERGIPVRIFDEIFKKYDLEIVGKSYCYTMMSFLQRKFGKYFKQAVFSYALVMKMDKYLSKLLKFNYTYHHEKFHQRIAPSNIFYVVRKK